MAYLSIDEYIGDGVTVDYAITFEYIEQDDVHVFVSGEVYPDFNFSSRSMISLDKAPHSGQVIRIQRYTEDKKRLAQFPDGAVLKGADLDLLAKQTFFIAQEVRDKARGTMTVDKDGHWNAIDRKIENIADGVDDKDAITLGQVKEPFYKAKVEAGNARVQADLSYKYKTESSQHADASYTSMETTKGYRDECEVFRDRSEEIVDKIESVEDDVAEATEAARLAKEKAVEAAESAKKSKEESDAASTIAQEAKVLAEKVEQDVIDAEKEIDNTVTEAEKEIATAKEGIDTSVSAAEAHATDSSTSATEANASATDASDSATDASTSATDASNEIDKIKAFKDKLFNIPVGAMVLLPVDSIPNGFLECNGNTVKASEYPDLVKYLTGDPDATEVLLPDMRGMFARGLDKNRGKDPDSATRTAGSEQSWAIENITGVVISNKDFGFLYEGTKTSGAFEKTEATTGRLGWEANYGGHNLSFDASRVVKTSTETRPANIALLYAIKAFDTVSDEAETTLETLIDDAKGAVHTPLGCIVQWQRGIPPAGWLELDGSTVRVTEYPDFVKRMAGTSASEYTLMDMRGEFARGWDHDRGVDASRDLGTAQSWAIENITGFVKSLYSSDRGGTLISATNMGAFALKGSTNYDILANISTAKTRYNQFDIDTSRVVKTSTETRPTNISTMFIIKVFDVAEPEAQATLETLIQDAKGAAHSPIGCVMDWMLPTPPTGWLELNGQTIKKLDYPVLVKRLEGAAATEAILPDCRGEFIRGWDHGRGVDASRDLGSEQGDAVKAHSFIHEGNNYILRAFKTNVGFPNKDVRYRGTLFLSDAAPSTDQIDIGGTETRPRNIAMMKIIKAADFVDDPDVIKAADVLDNIDDLKIQVAQLERRNTYKLIDAGSVTINTRYVFDNPFGDVPVMVTPELYYKDKWGDSRWMYHPDPKVAGDGSRASIYSNKEIILQTGKGALGNSGVFCGSPHLSNMFNDHTASARIHVWRCGV